jgi:hypothetical protein
MARFKRWPVLQELAPAEPVAHAWSHAEEGHALDHLASAVTAHFKAHLFTPGNELAELLSLQTMDGDPLVGPDSHVEPVREWTRGNKRVRVPFTNLTPHGGWGLRLTTDVTFEWSAHWPAVCAYRRAALGCPHVAAHDAAAKFVAALHADTPMPSLRALRLYGMPLLFNADGRALRQNTPRKFHQVRRSPVSKYRCAVVVHARPASLAAAVAAVLPSPVLVVTPEGVEGEGVYKLDLATMLSHAPGVRRAMKAARVVVMTPELYRLHMGYVTPLMRSCRLARSSARRHLDAPTMLVDVAWGAVVTVQGEAVDTRVAPPASGFHVALLEPVAWNYLEGAKCDAYAFHDERQYGAHGREGLMHVTLQFDD